MPAALVARDVVASYGAIRALHGVTVEMPAGQVTAIVGANGAGKSTLLRVLAGLHRADVGRVLLEGRDLTGQPAHRIARMGVALVPEGRGTFPALTVEENIRIAGRRSSRERVLAAFPALGDRLHQRAGTLSGGEQQMLALARAVGTSARVVLLDEPSLALAPRLVDEIFGIIGELRAEGRTIVLVEQYVRRAMEIADVVYVLRKGQVVFGGEPAELSGRGALERTYLGVSR